TETVMANSDQSHCSSTPRSSAAGCNSSTAARTTTASDIGCLMGRGGRANCMRAVSRPWMRCTCREIERRGSCRLSSASAWGRGWEEVGEVGGDNRQRIVDLMAGAGSELGEGRELLAADALLFPSQPGDQQPVQPVHVALQRSVRLAAQVGLLDGGADETRQV